WQELRGHAQHQTIEVLRLIFILLQDAVILVAGFVAEYVYEHWLHSEHPFFQVAVSMSSAFFLLLYVITVTVHVVQYVRGQVGAKKTTWLGDKLPWAIIGGGVLAAAVALTVPSFRLREVQVAEPMRLSLTAPDKYEFAGAPVTPLAISPDGKQVAFGAYGGALPQVWVRRLDALDAKPLPGTEGVTTTGPISWSPDSRSVGFVAVGKLKKVEIAGGPAQILAEATGAFGGSTWNAEGTIIFSRGSNGLFRIPASGGEPTQITQVDFSRGEYEHRYPYFLPDGKHFLYMISSSQPEVQGIYLASLDSKETTRLLNVASQFQYVPSGYLLYIRSGTLVAQAFNTERFQLSGDPFPVVESVGFNLFNGFAAFSVSDTGVLVYRGGFLGETQLTWFDRSGRQSGVAGPAGEYLNPRLSPDGRQIAVEGVTQGNRDIWLLEIERGIASRFTYDLGWDYEPLWSPDSKRILFASLRGGFGLYEKQASGSGNEELVFKSGPMAPFDWSADGDYVVYNAPVGAVDLNVLSLFGDPRQAGAEGRKSAVYLETPFQETHAQISPDGRWLAYVSNESGRDETYIQSFPKAGAKRQVSTNGGVQPRWRRDGKELFYIALDSKLMAVAVRGGESLEFGAPAALFTATTLGGVGRAPMFRQQYDVTADGQRFLLNVPVSGAASPTLTVVTNWLAGVKK
ncbi:MAG: PD40 domain-containing protein, partial [Acidobacteria bacterium]|nr:PD40 domain-containing protein [Acidobacteriota bacterium]